MADSILTGSDDDLFPTLDKAWIDGAELGRLDKNALYAWRDAAVARHLAEAGAVHPKVHTPNRVMQWLGEHGWQAATPVDPQRWNAEWIDSEFRTVFVPLQTDTVDYARYARYVVEIATKAAGLGLSDVLLEIALLPDEVAW